ncbi:MAG: phosphatidylglycerol lysyltransferase [Treponema sp.]|jgi:phosphoglucomutase|nr:phosphatidylglycerol lysyltransferase [Treponema sp.]
MVKIDDLNVAIDKMILSASGWRGVFAEDGNEESFSANISAAHRLIFGTVALLFVEYLHSLPAFCSQTRPVVFFGTDTRPTGKAIADVMLPVLLASQCDVRYTGVIAVSEIMAWARNAQNVNAGFIYISASHNPVGHNGIKFGLTDGGVLAAEEAEKLITQFRNFFTKEENIKKIDMLISAAGNMQLGEVNAKIAAAKLEAQKAYYDFCSNVVWDGEPAPCALKEGLKKVPLGIVCDFNGSARTVSIDKDFFSAYGIKFESINSEPGQIVHRIVPEGESLEPCAKLLEEAHNRDSSFVLGYVPDCDGDRGNLVIWDDSLNKARALEAQEVFALACVAEFSHLVWTGKLSLNGKNKAAVAINDPTSMRVDRIAESFGIDVFRAEVGEANVVSLARKLRNNGYTVRISGEGSAGGNITHPSAVRDPLHTVFAIIKMLLIRSCNENPGLFEIWCKLSGQAEKYCPDFTLTDIIASLPPFITTPSYSQDAILCIKSQDHSILKDRYQEVFLNEWENKKDELKTRFGIYNWEAIAYNKMTEKRNLTRFGDAGKGGLKVLFFDAQGSEIAYIWMRGSATEPVFRVLVDAEGTNKQFETYLLDWQRNMIQLADNK